jgi:hypothetical protein
LLDYHPGLLSMDELIRALTAAAETLPERDRIEVALRELVEAGVVDRLGSFVFAPYAAVQALDG